MQDINKDIERLERSLSQYAELDNAEITKKNQAVIFHRAIAQCALELLKKKMRNEGMEPVDDGTGCLICGNQGYACGVVGRRTENGIEKYCNYCPECGMKVKWDG